LQSKYSKPVVGREKSFSEGKSGFITNQKPCSIREKMEHHDLLF
jgi:hypothetical protein